MRKIFSIVTSLTLLLGVGCQQKADEVVTGKSEFKLEMSEVSAAAEGEDVEVNYTIIKPESGAVVLTECKASWIKNLSTATYGTIKFTVAPNYQKEARETTISVQYTAVEGKFEIKVSQAASTVDAFTVEVVSKDSTSLLLDITPADTTTAYICRTYTKAHIDAFFLTDDWSLINYDLSAIDSEAYSLGQTLLNYLQNISHTGKAGVEFTSLVPDTEYVVYCYHIDLRTGKATDEIVHREIIRTSKPATLDEDITMSFQVNGANIKQTVTTKHEDTYYYTECWSTNDFKAYFGSNATPEQIFPRRWNEQVTMKMDMGYQPYTIIEELCHQGTQTINYESLKANTSYIFYVFAIDPATAFTATDIVVETVSTLNVNESGMTITISVKNIHATTADIYWTASDENGKFARSVFTKAEFNALGATDEEKFATIMANYDFYQAVGSTDMNLYNLVPSTEYVAFAYGLDGSTPNTRIFTTEFKTKSNTPGNSNIKLSWNEHYNMAELAAFDAEHWGDYAAYDGCALLPITISGAKESDKVYFMVTTMPLDWYSNNEQWLRDVTDSKNLKNLYSNYNFMAEYEREYSVIAVAEDENGNYGQLFTSTFYLYKSDSVDVESYVYTANK
ncbi:MAG: BACON domain-containing protein [Alistipes sp.]|nr:BACON domain-containing protein [Alistipes sp.]